MSPLTVMVRVLLFIQLLTGFLKGLLCCFSGFDALRKDKKSSGFACEPIRADTCVSLLRHAHPWADTRARSHWGAATQQLCPGGCARSPGSPQASEGSGEAERPTSAHILDIHHEMVKASGFGLPFSGKASSWSSCSAKVWRWTVFMKVKISPWHISVQIWWELRETSDRR